MHPTPTLEEAYRLYSKRVYFVCFQIFRNREAAEDMMQEIFLHLATRLHMFRGESAFATWIHRVAINKSLMQLRKDNNRARLNAFSLDQILEDPAMRDKVEQALLTEDDQLAWSIERIEAEQALQDLPPRWRETIELRYGLTLSLEETADRMGLTIGAVKSNTVRSTQMLRGLVQGLSKTEARLNVH